MSERFQWVKFHIINTCNQEGRVWDDLTYELLIERQNTLWSNTPEVTNDMIITEVDRLIATGQIVNNGQRFVVGTPIFEERVPVTDGAEKAAKKIMKSLLDRRGIKHEVESWDQDVKDEFINTMAKLIDESIPRKAAKR